ncbi:MAG: hypothetical protein ACR2MG_01235 [Pyrinomonadaceae bacterium]
MENPENQDTLPNLETILNAINGLRQEMNMRFDKVEMRLTNVESRLTNVENDVRQIKDMQFVFENEFDRLLALSHKALQLSHENRADVRIMRKEIEAWSADVMNLERKVA